MSEHEQEYQRRPDRTVRRPFQRKLSAFAKQAVEWRVPERSFVCCGTEFRAMTAEALLLMRDSHQTTHANRRNAAV